MTDQHPLTPPPELVQQWREQLFSCLDPAATVAVHELSRLAAQWGADQELEACCKTLEEDLCCFIAADLRTARRPKPPSLKVQALLALSHLVKGANESMDTTEAAEYIRRALEALSDD